MSETEVSVISHLMYSYRTESRLPAGRPALLRAHNHCLCGRIQKIHVSDTVPRFSYPEIKSRRIFALLSHFIPENGILNEKMTG